MKPPASLKLGDNVNHEQVIARFKLISKMGEHHPVATIARMIDVPERTLRHLCWQYLGESPGRYIRRHRIELARAALLNERTTVTRAAMQHGFHELGRFAERYRKHFGELPSATLRANGASP